MTAGPRSAPSVPSGTAAPLSPGYREAPLWTASGVATPVPAGPLPALADVVVVGAGYCGATAAWQLARRGARVVVVDAGRAGDGASTRNGGMVLPELKHGLRWLTRRHGELGAELVDAALEAFSYIERVVCDEGIDCDYERTGALLLAHHPALVPTLREQEREWVDDLGQPARFLPRDRLHEEIATDAYVGGLALDTAGGVQPAKLHAGLVRTALTAGAEIHEHTRALHVERGAGARARVHTSRGVIDAGDVLVATNAYADGLLPPLRRRVLPVGSFIIATEPLEPGLRDTVIPHGRMVFDTRNFLCYWRMSPDGRMVFGGRTDLVPTTVPRAREQLYRRLLRVHPQLAGARVEYAWGGAVAITLDRLPHCGRLDGGVAFATGCNGTGVALTKWLGARAAAWLCGEEQPPPFARLPFRAIPLHAMRRAYLPLVGEWFRLRDRFGR